MTQSARSKVFHRAARLWNAKRYHEAITVLEVNGLGQHRREFVQFAHKVARARYVRIMTRYQP